MKDSERIAREKNFYLWRLRLDGRTLNPPRGVIEIEGPLPPECRDALVDLLIRWGNEGKI